MEREIHITRVQDLPVVEALLIRTTPTALHQKAIIREVRAEELLQIELLVTTIEAAALHRAHTHHRIVADPVHRHHLRLATPEAVVDLAADLVVVEPVDLAVVVAVDLAAVVADPEDRETLYNMIFDKWLFNTTNN